MRHELKIFLLLATIAVFSCTENYDFQSSMDFDRDWTYADSLFFDFEIADTTQTYQLGMDLKWDISQYPYQNCYFRINTLMPNGKRQSDLINLDFLNKTGVSIGKCRGDLCKTDYVLQPSVRFNLPGVYRISIGQETREGALSGITNARLYLKKQG